MDIRKMLLASTLTVGVVAGGVLAAQGPPPPNVDPRAHPNLANAQQACDQAYNYLKNAQNANEYDMQGHAQRAVQLLQQANREIKLAALQANRKGR
jgi:hypothetical protein